MHVLQTKRKEFLILLVDNLLNHINSFLHYVLRYREEILGLYHENLVQMLFFVLRNSIPTSYVQLYWLKYVILICSFFVI